MLTSTLCFSFFSFADLEASRLRNFPLRATASQMKTRLRTSAGNSNALSVQETQRPSSETKRTSEPVDGRSKFSFFQTFFPGKLIAASGSNSHPKQLGLEKEALHLETDDPASNGPRRSRHILTKESSSSYMTIQPEQLRFCKYPNAATADNQGGAVKIVLGSVLKVELICKEVLIETVQVMSIMLCCLRLDYYLIHWNCAFVMVVNCCGSNGCSGKLVNIYLADDSAEQNNFTTRIHDREQQSVMKTCEDLVDELIQRAEAWPFVKPVTRQEVRMLSALSPTYDLSCNNSSLLVVF